MIQGLFPYRDMGRSGYFPVPFSGEGVQVRFRV